MKGLYPKTEKGTGSCRQSERCSFKELMPAIWQLQARKAPLEKTIY
jgi:hypothetical protein